MAKLINPENAYVPLLVPPEITEYGDHPAWVVETANLVWSSPNAPIPITEDEVALAFWASPYDDRAQRIVYINVRSGDVTIQDLVPGLDAPEIRKV